MRILANENVARVLVDALREQGHDVFWARTDAPGEKDVAHLNRAQQESRVLLTFDTDFGELAFRHQLPASSGIILLRLTGLPESVVARSVQAIASRPDWQGQFAVIEPDRIRIRPLPTSRL